MTPAGLLLALPWLALLLIVLIGSIKRSLRRQRRAWNPPVTDHAPLTRRRKSGSRGAQVGGAAVLFRTSRSDRRSALERLLERPRLPVAAAPPVF